MAKKPQAKKSSSDKKAPAAKKTNPARKSARTLSARDKLANELIGLIEEIDAEGLLFLVRQANVLLHNKRVDELNAELEKKKKGGTEGKKKAGTTARVGENAQEVTVDIQQSPDAKTYYMTVDEQRHFLTSEEMAAVVKLCFAPEHKVDALRFLFQYMDNERKEILLDHGISTQKHPFFEALFYEVRTKFTLND